MEEARKGQAPEAEFGNARTDPEPVTPSVGAHQGPQTERERRLIEEGQAKAKRDEAEMAERGFGHHIGEE